MDLKTWLKAERGRSKALAEHLGVVRGRITQMADGGVPIKFMRSVIDFTDGEVSLEALVFSRTPQAEAAEAKAA